MLLALALALNMSLFRLRSLTPTSSANCRYVLLDYKGRIIAINVHQSLICLFYLVITAFHHRTTPLGYFLQLHHIALGSSRVQVLINMLLTYYLCVCHQSNVIYCFQYC